MRLKSASFKEIWLRWRASTGAISRSIAWSSSLVAAPARLKKTFATRSRLRPLRSSASIVLAKVGDSGFAAMASISARWSFSATSNAGRKCLGSMLVERRRLERPGPGFEERVLVNVGLGHQVSDWRFAPAGSRSGCRGPIVADGRIALFGQRVRFCTCSTPPADRQKDARSR